MGERTRRAVLCTSCVSGDSEVLVSAAGDGQFFREILASTVLVISGQESPNLLIQLAVIFSSKVYLAAQIISRTQCVPRDQQETHFSAPLRSVWRRMEICFLTDASDVKFSTPHFKSSGERKVSGESTCEATRVRRLPRRKWLCQALFCCQAQKHGQTAACMNDFVLPNAFGTDGHCFLTLGRRYLKTSLQTGQCFICKDQWNKVIFSLQGMWSLGFP